MMVELVMTVLTIKRVAQRITLTMRRTFTYSHGVKSNVNTEYLWDVSQESTSV